jgi:hypothetical protein
MALEKVAKTEAIETEKELKARLIELSKKHRNYIFSAVVTFGVTTIYKSTRKADVKPDSPTARCMMDCFRGVGFKNGKLLKPSKSWLDRHNHIPFRD